jgi:hypothetical protein
MRHGKNFKGSSKGNMENKRLKYDYRLKGPSRAMSNVHHMCSSSQILQGKDWWASLRGVLLGAVGIIEVHA